MSSAVRYHLRHQSMEDFALEGSSPPQTDMHSLDVVFQMTIQHIEEFGNGPPSRAASALSSYSVVHHF